MDSIKENIVYRHINIVEFNVLSKRIIFFFLIQSVSTFFLANKNLMEYTIFSPGLIVYALLIRVLGVYSKNYMDGYIGDYIAEYFQYFIIICNILFLIGVQFLLSCIQQIRKRTKNGCCKSVYRFYTSDIVSFIIILVNIWIFGLVFLYPDDSYLFGFNMFNALVFSFIIYFFVYILLDIVFKTAIGICFFKISRGDEKPKIFFIKILKTCIYIFVVLILSVLYGKIGQYIELFYW
jgi:hypothetical protein